MCRSMVDIQSPTAEIRRGKKEEEEEGKKLYRMKIYMVSLLHRATIKQYTRMWASAQRYGHPAEYRWRRLFNAAKFG